MALLGKTLEQGCEIGHIMQHLILGYSFDEEWNFGSENRNLQGTSGARKTLPG